MAVDTTTTLSNEMKQFLVEDFLARSEQLNPHGEGAKKTTLGKNQGKTVTWNRRNPTAAATTALTEGVNPAEVAITGNTVTATLAGYGNWYKLSSLVYHTSIDKQARETVELAAQNASETIDTVVRDVLFSGATTQFAAGRASLSTVTAADILNSTEVRKAVRRLKKNNAMTYGDGYFLGKIGPDTSYNLMGDTAWIDVNKYNQGGKAIYSGEVGKIHKVRFIEASSNQKFETSTVSVYSNFIHGKEAFGTVDLSGEGAKKLIIKKSDAGDTSNALNQFMTIGWKAEAFAAAVLNNNWIINVKTGAQD